MTHRDKFEFVNELHSTMNREFARATPEPRESITRNAHCALREGFPLRPSCYASVHRETLLVGECMAFLASGSALTIEV